MRIGVIVFSHYLRDGRVRRAAEALAARGDDVHLLCLAEGDRPARETLRGVHLERFPIERLSLGARPTRSRYLVEYGGFGVLATRRLLQLNREAPLDLVHVHNMPDLLVLCAQPLRLLGVPVVLDIHDLMPDLYLNKFGGRSKGPLYRALVSQLRASAALADGLITVHEEAKALLMAHGLREDRIEVIINASDDAIFRPRAPAKELGSVVFAYHGSLSKRHGMDLALEAFARARRRSTLPLELRIVGEGDAVTALQEQAQRLELGAALQLTPHFLPVEELPAWLQGVHVGLAPYRLSATTDLMLPCKVFDYANLGIAVIMSRLRCAEKSFGEDAIRWVPGADIDALTEAMLELAQSEARRLSLVHALRAVCAPMAWPSQREKLLEILDRCAMQGPRQRALPSLWNAGLEALKGLS